MSDVSRIDTYGAKLVLLPYMLAIIGSCLYTIILGVYNGDFIQRDVLFPLPALLVIAVLTIIPYIGIYGLYKRYRSKETENVPDKFKVAIIRNITWLLLLVHIGLLFTGYGQMGTSIEIDGGFFSYIRSAFFKLMVRPWVIAYLLISNSRKNLAVTVLLFSIHTILAHSLGGFFILLLILLFRQGKKVKSFVKRNFLFVLAILYSVPIVVSSAYNVRAQLRGQGGMSETSNMDIMVGKLCGRISSFSNSAYILQNSSQNVYDLELIPDFFYFYDTLHYWGYRPEFKSTGFYVEEQIKHSKLENSSTMPGVIGVLIMSYVKSPYIFLFNLFLMTFLLIIIFNLTKRIGFPNASGIAYILTIEFATSGDISALSNTIYTLLIIWFTLSISNIIIWK